MAIGMPMCVQCGTRSNPCRCKVVGPTLGFLAFAAAVVVEWPVGAVVYLFKHRKGRKIMAGASSHGCVSNRHQINTHLINHPTQFASQQM